LTEDAQILRPPGRCKDPTYAARATTANDCHSSHPHDSVSPAPIPALRLRLVYCGSLAFALIVLTCASLLLYFMYCPTVSCGSSLMYKASGLCVSKNNNLSRCSRNSLIRLPRVNVRTRTSHPRRFWFYVPALYHRTIVSPPLFSFAYSRVYVLPLGRHSHNSHKTLHLEPTARGSQ
jgi:hypothetical protein